MTKHITLTETQLLLIELAQQILTFALTTGIGSNKAAYEAYGIGEAILTEMRHAHPSKPMLSLTTNTINYLLLCYTLIANAALDHPNETNFHTAHRAAIDLLTAANITLPASDTKSD